MTIVVEDLDLPDSTTPWAQVDITLAGAECRPVMGYHSLTHTMIGTRSLKPSDGINADGSWQADLVPNSLITPAGTQYRITRRSNDGSVWSTCHLVPVVTGAGTVSTMATQTDATGPITPTALAAHMASQSVHGWTVTGGVAFWNGPIHTNHDAQYFYPADMHGTAGLVTNAATLNAPPYWAFDQTVVERIKWTWTPGDAWASYVVRMGWLNTGFAAGNVRWRYYERRNVVNAGSPNGDWTAAPVQVAEITSAAPLLNGNKYEDLAVAVPTSPLTVVMSVIERIIAGVPSNLAGDAGIYIVTTTRT